MTQAPPQSVPADLPWPRTLEAFETAVGLLQDRLVSFAWSRLGNREEAEDAVQDVLVRAWKDRDRLSAVDRFTPYVFRMTANRCTDVIRRRRSAPLVDSALPADELAPDVLKVRQLVAELPPAQSEVLRLHVYSELSFAEIADVIQAPLATVRSRFRYAVDKLRSLLNRGEGK